MKYELWEVCFFEEKNVQSLILIKSFDNFTDVYTEFKKLIRTIQCCIVLNDKGD
jgi:hypothetical protein